MLATAKELTIELAVDKRHIHKVALAHKHNDVALHIYIPRPIQPVQIRLTTSYLFYSNTNLHI